MQHRQARRIFSQRKVIVEPVSSSLRGQQRLDRFRRRGLRAVKREFALHVMAHNLSRAVVLLRVVFFYLYAVLYPVRTVPYAFFDRMQRFLGLCPQPQHRHGLM
jgi:hypothetical protein